MHDDGIEENVGVTTHEAEPCCFASQSSNDTEITRFHVVSLHCTCECTVGR